MAESLKKVRVLPAAPKTAHGVVSLKRVRVLGAGKK
jgi:hypothetical protein